MQIIHDVAPGSNLAFHTGFGGAAVFANGIIRLATEAGCKVIVDDLFYFFEPAFQDGIIARAVDRVRNRNGVAYFSRYVRECTLFTIPFLNSCHNIFMPLQCWQLRQKFLRVSVCRLGSRSNVQ